MAKGNKKLSGAAQRKAARSDFAKVRHKVGRKLPAPANATVTRVSARRLVLQGQSVGVDRSQRAVTARGLAVEDLVPQLSHYAPRVRNDAVTGVQELLTTHPWCVSLASKAVLFWRLCATDTRLARPGCCPYTLAVCLQAWRHYLVTATVTSAPLRGPCSAPCSSQSCLRLHWRPSHRCWCSTPAAR